MLIRISYFPKEYPVYISYHNIDDNTYNLLLYIFNEITLENFMLNEAFSNGNSDIDIINEDTIIKEYIEKYSQYQFDLLKHIINVYKSQSDHTDDKLLTNKVVEYQSDTESSEIKIPLSNK